MVQGCVLCERSIAGYTNRVMEYHPGFKVHFSAHSNAFKNIRAAKKQKISFCCDNGPKEWFQSNGDVKICRIRISGVNNQLERCATFNNCKAQCFFTMLDVFFTRLDVFLQYLMCFFVHLQRIRKKDVFFSLVNFSQSQSKAKTDTRQLRSWIVQSILDLGGSRKVWRACFAPRRCNVARLNYLAKPDLGMNLQVLIRRNKRTELQKLCR